MVILTCIRTYLRSIRGDRVANIGLEVKKQSAEYIDSLKLRVIGGSGGNGCPVSKAIGGSGGNVIVEASSEMDNLARVKSNFPDSKVIAGNGLDGRKTRLIGPDGSDCVFKVPCGVTVLNEYLSPIADLVKDGDKTIVAHGGPGGTIRSNFFGVGGQSQYVTLDLRHYADIGLVGYPDSGKSLLLTKLVTSSGQKLLSSIERTFEPKRPWLQDIAYEDGREISCVDLPSLIEGAHQIKKAGHHYLKHLYHNQLILFVIDVSGFNRGIYRSPIEILLLLNKQIEIYDDRYLSKPSIILVNKMDLPHADVEFEKFLVNLKKIYSNPLANTELDKSILPKRLIYYQDIIPISCVADRNIDYLKLRIRELIDFNYLRSRKVDSPRTFVNLLSRLEHSRAQTKVQLM